MTESPGTTPRRLPIVPLLLCLTVAVLWVFPEFWYTRQPAGKLYWFGEKRSIPGWQFKEAPVDQSAERLLVADRTVNGEFSRDGEPPVRVFSAKRFREKSNEIGLFVHTPDRCWVETGWKIEPAEPELREVDLHGIRVPVERRIFIANGSRELVYFFGLVGGQPLPYRLDHNLSVGLRSSSHGQGGHGARLRASDPHFWARLWNSFESRREFSGPKQFIRISTPVSADDFASGDQRVEKVLREWLEPVDYQQDRAQWEMAMASPSTRKASD